MEKRKLNNEGFSLIELIVVIAIMAILVGALAPQFLKYIERTNVSTDMQNVQALKTAVEVYVADQASTGNAISDDLKISLVHNASPATATISSAGASVTLNATDFGLSNLATTLKSKNWSASVVYTYSKTTNTWSANPTTGSANDGKNMNSVFGL